MGGDIELSADLFQHNFENCNVSYTHTKNSVAHSVAACHICVFLTDWKSNDLNTQRDLDNSKWLVYVNNSLPYKNRECHP